MSKPLILAALAAFFILVIAMSIGLDRWQRRPRTPKRAASPSAARRLTRFFGMGHLPVWVALPVFLVVLAIWVPLFGALVRGLLTVVLDLMRFDPGQSLTDEQKSLARLSLLSLTALTAALGAVVAFPFTVLRTRYNARQTEAAEQGLITDRINKAVEGLGAEKTVKVPGDDGKTMERTLPNIEVRIGAIYALERISQDSERDHIQIMEILCAYIRENAPSEGAPKFMMPNFQDDRVGITDDAVAARKEAQDNFNLALFTEINSHRSPRTDIQIALDVIGRRSPARIAFERARPYRGDEPFALDLRRTNLRRADLSKRNLSHARLDGAQLQGTNLSEARLQGAELKFAQLQGAELVGARLQGANLLWAKLQGAYLRTAQFDSATDLRLAPFRGAGLQAVDLSMLSVSLKDFEGSFGDGFVIVPTDWGEARPTGWVREKLDRREFETRWRAYQVSIGYDPKKPDA